MRLGIIHGFDEGYFHREYAKKILEEICKLGHEGIDISTNDLRLVATVSAAYLMPHALRLDFEQLSRTTAVINSYRSQNIAMDKIKTSRKLIENNISTPETVISENFSDITDLLDKKSTIIIKYPFGCAGFGQFIVYKDKDIVAIGKKGKHRIEQKDGYLVIGDETIVPPYYAQEFISFNGDHFSNDRVFRIYVVGNDVKMATLRVKKNVKGPEDSIINIAQGANYQFINIEQALASTALKVADIIGFDIGVVDLLIDAKGRHYVIECDCDGRYSAVDRKFKELPDFNDEFNFDKMIAKRLVEIAKGKEYRF